MLGLLTGFSPASDDFCLQSHGDADVCGEDWAAPIGSLWLHSAQQAGVVAATLLSCIQFWESKGELCRSCEMGQLYPTALKVLSAVTDQKERL